MELHRTEDTDWFNKTNISCYIFNVMLYVRFQRGSWYVLDIRMKITVQNTPSIVQPSFLLVGSPKALYITQFNE